jgi:hypothetical protein
MVASQGRNEGEIVEFDLIHRSLTRRGLLSAATLLPPRPIGAIMTPA